MRKNVLPEAIKELGISSRDVIRVYKKNHTRDYQYENGVFTWMNAPKEKIKDGSAIMTEDELYELLNGGEFEILAYGAKPTNDELLHKIDQIEKTVKLTQEFVNDINVAIDLDLVEKTDTRTKREKVIGEVCDVILCVAGLIGFFTLLALIF